MPHRGRRPVKRWSMYPKLHDDVVRLLAGEGLIFNFYNVDEDKGCTDNRDTHIMGRFICHNRACSSNGWSSKKIAITIRMYHGHKYNARVYHQRCKRCGSLSRPLLDESYAERATYWIKKWSGVVVEKPSSFGDSKGPHNSQLCEGCKAGHCSELRVDWITKMENEHIKMDKPF
ncbi:hypothetical protein EYZ11_012412 [Aspergillus tanneri]|uniref:3CxxC-type domain-containing protein n=1 Tax=Aspergillus tanneri TaxID=1220188 RepID=A0A4S3J0A8_9EURO|nr:hypothetical protein EYZ11_012412 [Aspergillus tanneri]